MSSTNPTNQAAYVLTPREKPLVVGSAPFPTPTADEIVIQNRAIAINPVDWFIHYTGKALLSFIPYPAILGDDVSGVVHSIGNKVKDLKIGDRITAMCLGSTKGHGAREGGLQNYTVVREVLTAKIPDELAFEKVVVLPLTLCTAAAGLFQKDFLMLDMPPVGKSADRKGEALLVWAGSTSVGCNAIQLANLAGYDVYTTCSPRNYSLVKRLGAKQVFDYSSPNVVEEIVDALKGKKVAGAYAQANGGPEACIAIMSKLKGGKDVKKTIANASVPWPKEFPEGKGQNWTIFLFVLGFLRFQISTTFRCMMGGVSMKFVVCDTIKDNEVGRHLFGSFLPWALRERVYECAPEPQVVGHGLEKVQEAFDVQKRGVSAKKIVVTL